MADHSNTLASAGTANLYGSVARLVLPFGPRIAFAPDGPGAPPVSEATLMDDLSDADLNLDDEEEGAPPPAEGEQAETEDEPEGDADLETEPEAEEDEPKDKDATDDSVKVKLDDGQEVDLGELKKGYLRQADYTRKTQEVARDRTEVAGAADRLIAFDKQAKSALQLAAQVINAYTPKPPDIALLQSGKPEDMHQYHLAKEIYEQGQQHLNRLAQAFEGQEQGAKKLSTEEHSALVGREMQALIAKAPDLRDDKKRAAAMSEITEGAQQNYGFSPKDLAAVTDHRAILVLRDALAYRKLQANKSATIAKVQATAPMRPATRQAPGQRVQAGQARDFERARRTGSEEDVARLLTSQDLGL